MRLRSGRSGRGEEYLAGAVIEDLMDLLEEGIVAGEELDVLHNHRALFQSAARSLSGGGWTVVRFHKNE